MAARSTSIIAWLPCDRQIPGLVAPGINLGSILPPFRCALPPEGPPRHLIQRRLHRPALGRQMHRQRDTSCRQPTREGCRRGRLCRPADGADYAANETAYTASALDSAANKTGATAIATSEAGLQTLSAGYATAARSGEPQAALTTDRTARSDGRRSSFDGAEGGKARLSRSTSALCSTSAT